MSNITPMEKLCKSCETVKPLTEFYRRGGTDDKRTTSCTECLKKYAAGVYARGANKGASRSLPGQPGEALLIETLIANGVYAAPGKSSVWKYVDVVAWGCIRIEVKQSSASREGRYTFQFPQNRKHTNVDLVALIPMLPTGPEFFLLEPSHPIFTTRNNQKNLVIQYTPGVRWGKRATVDEMQLQRNAWHLIEESRLRWIDKLKTTDSWSPWSDEEKRNWRTA